MLNQRDYFDNDKIHSQTQLTQKGILHTKCTKKSPSRNREHIGFILTLELRPAQELEWQKPYTIFSVSIRNIPEIEHELFPTDYFKLLVTNHYNFWQTSMIVTKNAFKYTTGK